MPRRRIRKSAHARADVRAIAQWIARDSVQAALDWADQLDRQFQLIAEVPGIGTDRGELRPGMRSCPFGNYLIFFKRMPGGIQIVRVLHGSRDYRRLLEEQ